MSANRDPRQLASARLEVVGRLASLINRTLDLREFFRTAILELERVLPFRRASVVLLSTDRSSYYLHTLYDRSRGGFIEPERPYPVTEGLTGEAIRSGKMIHVPDFVGRDDIRMEGETRVAVLIVPLRLGGVVMGALNLGAGAASAYNEEDIELAELLGRQIETSLQHSQLVATIAQQRDELIAERAQLEAERSQLDALIEASDAAVLMVASGRIVHVNGPMARLLGLTRELLFGAPVEVATKALARTLTDSAALVPQIAALESPEGILRDRVEFAEPNPRIVSRTVAPVIDPSGGHRGHVIVFRDITAEAAAEAAKAEFVSVVSHELRTPLTSINTSLGLLSRGAAGELSRPIAELVGIAVRNLERLLRLVDDLLDLARVESGRVATELTPVPLAEAAARAMEALQAFAESREVTVTLADLGGASPVVLADADGLDQVLVNLLANAVKFSPRESRVAIRWWTESGSAVLEVADQGPGIPGHQLEAIFDKFRQLESPTTRRHGGAGLGLAISRGIVEKLGGMLWAESEEGNGSRFFVRLLLARTAPPSVQSPVEPRTVLVVDRDDKLRRRLRELLESKGWKVITAWSGAEALADADRHLPMIAVVGIELADMHALEFLQRLRRLAGGVDLPVLLVGRTADPQMAAAYGADGSAPPHELEIAEEMTRLLSAVRRRLVLLVQDDAATRLSLARALRRFGYACMEAASPEEGLALIRVRAPSVVVTDVEFPGVDGLSFVRLLRTDPALRDVPIIIIAASDGAIGDAAQALEALGASVLLKPFQPSGLLREIGRLLASTTPPLVVNEAVGAP